MRNTFLYFCTHILYTMKNHLNTLFEYEKWANAKILEALSELKETDENSLDIMTHILLVQMVWYSRISNLPDTPVWAKKTLAQCKDLYEVNNKVLAPFFAKLTDEFIENNVEYKNTKGNRYNNTVGQILTHQFNHSTYHRGQIVERMKGKLPAMPVTDLIAFMRMK